MIPLIMNEGAANAQAPASAIAKTEGAIEGEEFSDVFETVIASEEIPVTEIEVEAEAEADSVLATEDALDASADAKVDEEAITPTIEFEPKVDRQLENDTTIELVATEPDVNRQATAEVRTLATVEPAPKRNIPENEMVPILKGELAKQSTAQSILEGRMPKDAEPKVVKLETPATNRLAKAPKADAPADPDLPTAPAPPTATEEKLANQPPTTANAQPAVMGSHLTPLRHERERQRDVLPAGTQTRTTTTQTTPTGVVPVAQNPWAITQTNNAVQTNKSLAERAEATQAAAEGKADLFSQLVSSERGGGISPTATAAPTTAGAETARHVANQMAVAIRTEPGRATEIALNPRELGRVRLSMTAVDATITLTVIAERQETTDLLRRHIDTLAQEFKSLGYDDISFSFAGGNQTDAGTDTDTEERPNPISQIEAEDLVPDQARPQPQLTSGLDLRL